MLSKECVNLQLDMQILNFFKKSFSQELASQPATGSHKTTYQITNNFVLKITNITINCWVSTPVAKGRPFVALFVCTSSIIATITY